MNDTLQSLKVVEMTYFQTPGPRCIKLTINGNFAFNRNYHGNKTPYPISIKDSMEVTIKIQLTIKGNG